MPAFEIVATKQWQFLLRKLQSVRRVAPVGLYLADNSFSYLTRITWCRVHFETSP